MSNRHLFKEFLGLGFWLVLIILIGILPLEAAFEEKPFPRVWGQGGAFLAVEEDLHCLYYNPAGLHSVSPTQLVIIYGQLFQLEDLRWDAVILGGGRIASGYQRFGFPLYQEEIYALGTGFSLGSHYFSGIGIYYHTLKIPDFQTVEGWTGKLGFLGSFSSQFQWGLTYYFPFSPAEETFRESWSVGVGWKAKEGRLLLDIIGEKGEKVFYRVGGEIQLAEIFILRCGYRSFPPRYSLGWGIKTELGEIDYTYLSHPVLPGTHLYSLTIRW